MSSSTSNGITSVIGLLQPATTTRSREGCAIAGLTAPAARLVERVQHHDSHGSANYYAPWLRNGDEVKAVCAEVSAPVNVLARPEMSMSEIVEAGGQRVSVGSWLTWVALEAMVAAAEEVRDTGSFASLAPKVNVKELLAGGDRE